MQRQGDCICTPRGLETEEMFQGKKSCIKLTCDLDEFVGLAKGAPEPLTSARIRRCGVFRYCGDFARMAFKCFPTTRNRSIHNSWTRQWYHQRVSLANQAEYSIPLSFSLLV
jgi:hypothetical protein